MSTKYLLGIDNGGTNIKAALFDMSGRQVACKSANTPLVTPQEGYTQRSMEELMNINYQLIAELVKEYGSNIAAVGLCGHGKGLYLLGKSREIIYDGIGSTDRRAQKYEITWRNDGTEQKAYEKTAQKIMACHPAALLKWLKENDIRVYEKVGYVLSVKDYVKYRLTGEITTDYTDASGSGILNLRTRKYDKDLLSLFDIPEMEDNLPPIIQSSDVCGKINRESAEKTGLKEGTPVVGGMFDIDACAVASGASSEGDTCIIAGTWSINECISSKIADDHSVAMNSVFCDPKYYLAEESSATSVGNLEWFKKILRLPNYRCFEETVAKMRADECNIYYLPFLFASNENPLAKGALIGLGAHHEYTDIIRAVYEGVAFSHLTHMKALTKTLIHPKKAKLAGGVVNSDGWIHVFADVLDIELEVTENIEIGTKGAAMAAGIGAGFFNNYGEATAAFVKTGKTVAPDPENVKIYKEKYEKYRQIVEALDKVW